MKIHRTFTLPCSPDAAWEAIHSPTVAAQVYAPLLQMRALTPLSDRWESGVSAVMAMRALGLVTVGTQSIEIQDGAVPSQQVRIMRDSGTPLSGPLAGLTLWDHRMAVRPDPRAPGGTIWHDRLMIAGPRAPLLWPGLWVAWRIRQERIKQLARYW